MDIRKDFPILDTAVRGKPLIYLDSAATMQMPLPVLERMERFYRCENANIHRGVHSLSEAATAAYERARETAAQFIGAEHADEIIFTSGTTASVNLAAAMLEPLLSGGEIVVTGMEHHSNLLPWMELAGRNHLTLRVVPVTAGGTLDEETFLDALNEQTRIVALTEVSNVTGIRNPVAGLIRAVRARTRAWVLVDGAQGVVHGREPVRETAPDFYCFSGHKLGAPGGTGVLYVRRAVQAQLRPCQFGGGTVRSVRYDAVDFLDGPSRFEPGTPNYAGVIGLDACLQYWMALDGAAIAAQEQALLTHLEQALSRMDGVRIPGQGQTHFGCLSFAVDGIPAYDICRLLDQYGVAVRSGHLCAQPYLEALGYRYVVRVSVAPYTTRRDIDGFLQYLAEILTLERYRRDIADSSALPMAEVEADILSDLAELQSPMEQYAFLTACAADCLPMPERYRNAQSLIRECQVNTWVWTDWLDGKCLFYGDSEALIVKGVLALLQELYAGRSREEVRGYRCGLLGSDAIARQLSRSQQAGLTAIVKKLENLMR